MLQRALSSMEIQKLKKLKNFVIFDTFFDCLNGRSKGEHIKRRKPNLKPYYKADDERLKVSNDI